MFLFFGNIMMFILNLLIFTFLFLKWILADIFWGVGVGVEDFSFSSSGFWRSVIVDVGFLFNSLNYYCLIVQKIKNGGNLTGISRILFEFLLNFNSELWFLVIFSEMKVSMNSHLTAPKIDLIEEEKEILIFVSKIRFFF